MNHAELIMRRRNVAAFIDADPVKVSFQRKGASTRTAAGGKVPGAVTDLDPQKARIVLNKRRYTAGIVNAEAGDIPQTDYLLIGSHRLDVEVNDEFSIAGVYYKVIGIYQARIESRLCAIEFRGEANA